MSTPRLSVLRLAALPLAIAASWAANAEQALPSATELDAVKVNAERRAVSTSGALGARSQLDTPYATSSVGADELRERQVVSVASAFFSDPSVTPLVNDDGIKWSSSGISVRGLSLASGAGTKVDGLSMATGFSELPLETVERVDLLKGPAGFMYGFGAPGGIVNYVTKRPTDTPLLRASVGYRSSSILTLQADAGGRLGNDDRYGYRFNVAREHGETYNGSTMDRKVVSAAVDMRVTDSLDWEASWVWQDRMLEDANAFFMLGSGVTRAPGTVDGSRDFSVDGSFLGVKTWAARTALAWQIAEDWKATFSLGRTHFEDDVSFPYGTLINDAGDYVLNGYGMANRLNTNQAQALLEGVFHTGPLKHQVVAGIYWSNAKEDTPLDTTDGCVDGCTGNIRDGITFSYNPNDRLPGHHRYGESTEKAAFLSDTISWGRWSALLGARYNDYRFEQYDYSTGRVASEYRKRPVTPSVALMFKPAPWATLYASYVEALEQGTTVGTGYLNMGEILPAMVSKQWELGMKFDHARWSADAAVFRIDRGGNIDRVTDIGKYLIQDGITRYEGVEMSALFRATDHLRLQGGLTVLDPTYKELSPVNAANLGNQASGVAKRQIVAQVSYTVPALPALEMHAGARHYGSYYNDAANQLKLPSYTLANAGFGYRFEGMPVTLRGEVNNLTDRQYWSTGGIGMPRTYSATVQVDF